MGNYLMRIGLLGGTFDPIHYGHLHQAEMMLEKHNLDEVWLIPARISPHKLDQPPMDSHHRLEMVRLATAENPKLRVLDLEIGREGPSYTIDTVREILEGHEGEFYLLISDDMVEALPLWKEIDSLIELIPLLVGQRKGELQETGNSAIDRAVKMGYTEMPMVPIEATDLRARFKQGKSCEGKIPEVVLKYIEKNQLYK